MTREPMRGNTSGIVHDAELVQGRKQVEERVRGDDRGVTGVRSGDSRTDIIITINE